MGSAHRPSSTWASERPPPHTHRPERPSQPPALFSCHTCMLETLRQDIRYAVRGLRATPGFTTGVVLTIALGIGANAAMFGIVDRMLFRPPPYLVDPSSTHRLYQTSINRGKESTSNFANQYARYRDVVRWTTSFSRTAGMTNRQVSVGVGDAARERWVASVSASFFGFFDAPPVLGRYFTAAADSIPNSSPVAVFSYSTWQLQYGGPPGAVRRPLPI